MATDIYLRYFMYSREQLELKKTVASKRGKTYVPGTVIVNGSAKQFTEMVTDPVNVNFSDAMLVTSGDMRKIKYTDPAIQ
jgi:hypothetical protein